jgi:hypothetical protein
VIGFDYTARIDPAALKAAGCSVVIRYTTWLGWPKSETHPEAVELAAAGIPVVANFESTADRMRGGAAAGHADAVEALGHLADLGEPRGVKVWFSADWDVQPAEVALCLDYLHAAADALGGQQFVGCYGGLRVVGAAADAGFATWQTVAWSGGRWDLRAVAQQTGEQRVVGGVTVDVNEIINLAALGAWLPGGTDMTPDESKQLTEIHQSAVDFANWQFFVPAGREQVVGTHAWRMQTTLDNTAAIKAAVDQLLARPVPPAMDVVALAAAIDAHLTVTPGATSDSIAAAVVAHLAGQLAKP